MQKFKTNEQNKKTANFREELSLTGVELNWFLKFKPQLRTWLYKLKLRADLEIKTSKVILFLKY
jgi:hypothetical protein